MKEVQQGPEAIQGGIKYSEGQSDWDIQRAGLPGKPGKAAPVLLR